MKHTHHILPRHMGGTDEPSNLVEVTPEQHAELHLALYLEHGRWQDWVAFHALSGQMSMSDASVEAIHRGAYHPNVRSPEANHKRSTTMKGRPQSIAHTEAKIQSAAKQRVITDEQLPEVQSLRSQGWTLKQIAKRFDTTATSVWRYIHKRVRGAN